MIEFWDTVKYFKSEEFDSPDKVRSGELMDLTFVRMLNMIRTFANIPFIVSSGYRTQEENIRVGGSSNSAHLRGRAVDIAAESSTVKYQILKASLLFFIPRLGIYEKHIHIDIDLSLPQPVVWWGNKEGIK